AGVLAHELCHAEEDCRHGPLLETLFSWFCERIPSLEIRMERRIDSAVIRKRATRLSAVPRPALRALRSNRRPDSQRDRGSDPPLSVFYALGTDHQIIKQAVPVHYPCDACAGSWPEALKTRSR